MDIRLIALDLDGTLLNSRKCISAGNLQVLFLCAQKGIQVVPATGRTLCGIPEEIRQIPGVRYAVTTNGAVIEDMEQGKAIYTKMLSWELALELLKLVDSYPLMYDPYIERRGITEPRFYEHLSEYGLTPELQEMVLQTRDLHPNIIEFVEKSRKPAEKINLFFASRKERADMRALLEKRNDIVTTSSISNNLEINAPGANKGEALLWLASHLGIKKEQVMAIGDGENDLTMIRLAGTGVAMKNGNADLLAAADYITENNDEDGVAAAINRLIFGVKQ